MTAPTIGRSAGRLVMNAIETLLMQPAAQAIGWALVQFIWQGALIGAITAIALAALRQSASDVRYVVATIGLSLMLTVPVVSAVQGWRAAVEPVAFSGLVETERAAANPMSPSSSLPTESRTGPATVLPAVAAETAPSSESADAMRILLLVWLCGVIVLTVRLMSGWLVVQRLRSHRTTAAPAALVEVAHRLQRRLHIARTVRFVQSAMVDVPTVIGWLKPVVLMPASALSALTPEQLEAIIAHELAHIRRHDYLVNLLQTAVETLLFYHPAVWWLSHRIRVEREHCCDDLAVSLCGDPVTYARALADLEGLRGAAHLGLAANGGSLLQRVRRLLGAPTHAGRGPGWLAGSLAILLMAGITAGAIAPGASSEPEPQGSAREPRSRPEVPALPVVQEAVAVAPRTATEVRAVEEALEAARIQMEAAARVYEAALTATQQVPVTDQARAMDEHARAFAEARRAHAVLADVARTVQIAQATGMANAVEQVRSGIEASGAAMAEVARGIATLAGESIEIAPAVAQSDRQSGNFTWSNNGEKLQVNYEGTFEFTDDDTDVRSLSSGGHLKIREVRMGRDRTIEFRADTSGNIERRFWSGSSERPFEPEGRQWLAEVLPRFIRQTGIGAPQRVARFLRQGGVPAVLDEISRIEGSFSRRIYYTELLKSDQVDERATEQVLARVGKDIESDFELASLLIASADKLLVNEPARRAYFDAARSIQSDFELRRVLSSALKKGPVSPDVLAGVLDTSLSIDSDFEAASLLIQLAKLQPIDGRTRDGFFKAAGTIASDFEQRRVLNELVANPGAGPDTIAAVLSIAQQIDSDFEAASLLLTVLKSHPVEGSVRAPFFKALSTIDSAFERGRVLKTVAKRTDASNETIIEILRATQPMGSSFEASQVLQAVAANHQIKGEARDLYIAAADRLSSFEQNQALAALVKSERAK
jgi:beta-lactamase regulating signal transducer with metallopeptidase domain